MLYSQKDHAALVLAGNHSPRVFNAGSFEAPRYVAWTPTWEGPARPDYPAALADLRSHTKPTEIDDGMGGRYCPGVILSV